MTSRTHGRGRRAAGTLLLALFAGLGLAAQEYDSNSAEVRALDAAYLRAGLLLPWTSFPLSRSRLRLLGRELEEGGGRIPDLPAFEPDEAPYRASGFVELNYAQRWSGQGSLVQATAPRDGIDLQRAWVSRPAFIRLGGLVTGGGVDAEMEWDLKKSWDGSSWYGGDNNSFLGDFAIGQGFDQHIFRRGIMAWESGAVRASLGRDAMNIGPPGFSSFYPSAALPFIDAGRMQTALGPFHFDWVIATFPAVKSWEGTGNDVDTQIGPTGASWGGAWLQADLYKPGSTNDAGSTKILFVLHRFAYENGRLHFGIAEEQMYARTAVPFEVVNFLPLGMFHKVDDRPDNLTFVIEGGYTLLPGLGLRFQAGLDDFRTNDIGGSDSPVPTIPAYLGGADFAFELGGVSLEGQVEAGYTHYLWGNFDADATQSGNWGGNGTFLARMIARYAGGYLLPLTSPYGPGSTWFRGEARLSGLPGGLGLAPRALLLLKNPRANLINTPYTLDNSLDSWSSEPFVDLGLELSRDLDLGPLAIGLSATPEFLLAGGRVSGALDLLCRLEFGGGAGNVGRGQQWW